MEPIAKWRPLRKYRKMTQEQCDEIREKYFIEVSGEDVPPGAAWGRAGVAKRFDKSLHRNGVHTLKRHLQTPH